MASNTVASKVTMCVYAFMEFCFVHVWSELVKCDFLVIFSDIKMLVDESRSKKHKIRSSGKTKRCI